MKKFLWKNKTELYVGENIFKELNIILGKKYVSKKIFIITDNNLIEFYREKLYEIFESSYSYKIITVPATEKSKSFSTLRFLVNELSDNYANRDSLLIAFGGGVISDLVGFLAGIYMRGIEYINIPTTLLGQVDSSIGGKTAINTESAKNLVGLFYHPSKVIIDTKFLNTLPYEDFLSGMGEVFKYFCLDKKLNFDFFAEEVDDYLSKKMLPIDLIYQMCEFKLTVVGEDEKDNDIRRILNFGHTFAHAIESIAEFNEWSHGEAVALGVIFALTLSTKLLGFSKVILLKYEQVYKKIFASVKKKKLDFNSIEIYKKMLYDKKNKQEYLPTFVLLKNIGDCEILEINEKTILETINEVKSFYLKCY